MLFYFKFHGKLFVIRCYTWFFSLWKRTGSNPADIIGSEDILELFLQSFYAAIVCLYFKVLGCIS